MSLLVEHEASGRSLREHPPQRDLGRVDFLVAATDIGMTAAKPHLLHILGGVSVVGFDAEDIPVIRIDPAPAGRNEPGPMFIERERVPHGLDDRVVPEVRQALRPHAAVRLDRVPDPQEINFAVSDAMARPEFSQTFMVGIVRPVEVVRLGEELPEARRVVGRQSAAIEEARQRPDREGATAEAEQECPVAFLVALGQGLVHLLDVFAEPVADREAGQTTDDSGEAYAVARLAKKLQPLSLPMPLVLIRLDPGHELGVRPKALVVEHELTGWIAELDELNEV